MKRILFPSVIAVLLLIAACAPQATPTPAPTTQAPPSGVTIKPSTPAPTPEVKKPTEKPKAYVYVTNPEGTSYYRAAVAQAAMITKYTGLNIIVQPGGGALVNPGIVGKGEAQISCSASLNGRHAYLGIRDYKEKYPFMRAMIVGHPTMWGFVVKADSGIKKIPDLKGKRVEYKLLGSLGQDYTGEAELRAYGLDPDKDIDQVTATNSPEAMNLVKSGRIDCYACSITEPSVAELDRSLGAYILPLDADKVDAVKAAVPGLTSYTVKDIPGAKTEIIAMGSPAVLWAHQDLPDEIAYLITKTLLENQKELEAVHPDFKHWTPETTKDKAADVWFPFHNGAIKYLKEKGLWTEQAEKAHQEVLKVYAK